MIFPPTPPLMRWWVDDENIQETTMDMRAWFSIHLDSPINYVKAKESCWKHDAAAKKYVSISPSWHAFINLLEYAIHTPLLSLCHKKYGSLLLFTVFLRYGQMNFSKASDSISQHLTLIFPNNFWIFWWLGGAGHTAWLSTRRARRKKSRGPKALQLDF